MTTCATSTGGRRPAPGRLHVRQYHDSRRSRALVLLDDDAAAYHGAGAFELAVSVAASVIVRLTQDAYDVSLVCGEHRVVGGTVDDLLDATCRITARETGDLLGAHEAATGAVAGAGLVLVVSGDHVDAEKLRVLRASFPHEATFLVLRAATAGDEPVGPTADLPAVLRVTALEDLPAALAVVSRQGVLT